jgi:hypothetical protein
MLPVLARSLNIESVASYQLKRAFLLGTLDGMPHLLTVDSYNSSAIDDLQTSWYRCNTRIAC